MTCRHVSQCVRAVVSVCVRARGGGGREGGWVQEEVSIERNTGRARKKERQRERERDRETEREKAERVSEVGQSRDTTLGHK